MSDPNTWRFDRIDRQLDRLEEILRDLRSNVTALERTVVRAQGERITRIEDRFMTPAKEKS